MTSSDVRKKKKIGLGGIWYTREGEVLYDANLWWATIEILRFCLVLRPFLVQHSISLSFRAFGVLSKLR